MKSRLEQKSYWNEPQEPVVQVFERWQRDNSRSLPALRINTDSQLLARLFKSAFEKGTSSIAQRLVFIWQEKLPELYHFTHIFEDATRSHKVSVEIAYLLKPLNLVQRYFILNILEQFPDPKHPNRTVLANEQCRKVLLAHDRSAACVDPDRIAADDNFPLLLERACVRAQFTIDEQDTLRLLCGIGPERAANIMLMLNRSARDVRSCLVSWLDQPALENLGRATRYSSAYQGIFTASKSAHFIATRPQRAMELRDHVMHWRYDEVKALVEFDPKVLEVQCDYKANRWLEDTEENIRHLSALEYAWWAGDENFIDLFERVGAHLLTRCDENKEALSAESIAFRTYLSAALNAYAAGGDWRDCRPLWDCAPTWIYGLESYLYQASIYRVEQLDKVDVFSDKFRSAGRRRDLSGKWGAPAGCCCLSARIMHPRSSPRAVSNTSGTNNGCQMM